VAQTDFDSVLLGKIAETVRGPAWGQSIKGVYTAGLTRTLKYVGAKIGKVSLGTTRPGRSGQRLRARSTRLIGSPPPPPRLRAVL
jgi:hypothetical protein